MKSKAIDLQQMKFGLKKYVIDVIKNIFIKYSQIDNVILFGSRAKGNYRANSDIDLTLKGNKLDFTTLLKIETELDDLLLPYKIDLSIFHNIENKELVEHIDRVGIVFYEKNKEWKEAIIGDYIDLLSGYAFKSIDFLVEKTEGTLPVIKIKNVANGDVNLHDVQYHTYRELLLKYVISNGDILIAMTGNHPQAKSQVVGDVSKYKLASNALLNQRVGKIIIKTEAADLDFFYYLFKSEDVKTALSNKSSGSANQANISKADILGLNNLLPSLSEQKSISAILCSLDDKIDLLHRQNAILESMAETLFRQSFVEEVKEEWEEKKLHDLLLITSSKRIFYSEYVNFGIPFYRSKEIIELHNTGSTNSELFITEQRFDEIEKKFGSPKIGDILLTSVGTLGIPYKVKKGDKFYFKDGNLTWFKDFRNISSNIIYCWLKSAIGKEQLDGITIGSTQAALTISGLKEIKLKIPSKPLLAELDSKLEIIYNKIESNQTQIRTLTSLRDTLLPKLMSGEVRLKN